MIDYPYIGCYLYSNILIINEIRKFSSLFFMCFWSLFHLVLRLFQPPNQGADNSETSVAWTFMQSFFRQCFKCTWSNKKITKNVGPHVGPTFFPLSFFDHRLSSAPNPFPWSPIHWRKLHKAMVCRWTSLCLGCFMNQVCKVLSEWANPNTIVCLYLYIGCSVRSNLRMSVLMSELSSYADGLFHGNTELQVHPLLSILLP